MQQCYPNTAKSLQTLTSKLNVVTEEYGMKIQHTQKTKVMVIAKKGNKKVKKIILNGDEIEQVKQFPHLRSVIKRMDDVSKK